MGDAADDLTDAGELQLELHSRGECNEVECPYCAEEDDWEDNLWWDGGNWVR